MKFIKIILIIFTAFSLPLVSYGATYSQLVGDTASHVLDSTGPTQALGTGYSGTLDTLSVKVGTLTTCNFSLCPTLQLGLYSFTNSSYGLGTTSVWTSPVKRKPDNSSLIVEFGTSTPIGVSFDPSLYYALYVTCTTNCSNASDVIYGASSSGDPGILYDSFFGNATTSIGRIYYEMGIRFTQSSNSEIRSIISPDIGTSTASSNVVFSYTYFSAGDMEYAGIQLEDTFGGQTLNVQESAITQSGLLTYSKNTVLTWSHGYRWRPYLRSGSSYIYGQWYSFSVGINPVYATSTLPYGSGFVLSSSSPYVFTSSASGTSSTSTTSITIYSVDEYCDSSSEAYYIASKFPFSYVCDFGVLVNELSSHDANSDFGITFPNNDTIVIFDNSFLADLEIMQTIRTYLAYVLWLMFAIYTIFFISKLLKFGQI